MNTPSVYLLFQKIQLFDQLIVLQNGQLNELFLI